jgi:hypothetical protein
MRRDLERRLADAETMAPEISWVDRQAADHRRSLRGFVALLELISQRLQVMRIDPQLAQTLRRGEAAAAELAAIPDTPELERADEAILRAKCSNSDSGAHVRKEIARMAELYRSGQHRIDFANASPAELLAFCIASEIEDRNKLSGSADETSDGAQPNAAIRSAPNLTICPSRA